MKVKTVRNAVLLAVAAVLAIMTIIVSDIDTAYADEVGYKFTVTVYSGRQGTFNGKRSWSREYSYGERAYITLDDLGFSLKKGSKYYVRGFRIAGHDNDETTGFQTMTFDVTEDVSYEVAYGIKGDMVAYTAKYVEKDSNKEIHKPDTYYGMKGDKPVVSFRYIEGYEPDTYNLTKTLSEDESENIMVFYYTREGAGGNGNNEEEGNGGDADGGNQPGPAAPGTAGNPAGTNVDDGRGTDNIDDNRTPTTDNNKNGKKQTTDLDPQKTPLAVPFNSTVIIAGSILLMLLLLLIILIILKRRRKHGEDPAEE